MGKENPGMLNDHSRWRAKSKYFHNEVYCSQGHPEVIAAGCTSERSKLNSAKGSERQEVILEQRCL